MTPGIESPAGSLANAERAHDSPFPWLRRAKHAAWILPGLLAAILSLHHLGEYRPLTSHEVLVAQTAKEMWQSGNWVEPTCFGEPRHKKPPLAYWITAGSYWLWNGPSEWAARFPAALAGIVLVIGVARWTTKHFDEHLGLAAGFCQATSVYFLTQSRLAEADMLLALSVSLAMFTYGDIAANVETGFGRRIRGTVYSFWFWLAIAVLAKGPVAILIVFSAIAGHVFAMRRIRPVRLLLTLGSMAWFLGLTLAWPIAVLLSNPSIFNVWRQETWQRFFRDPNDVVRYPFYYPLAALWMTLPWTPLWLARIIGMAMGKRMDNEVAKPAARNRDHDSIEWLLACWLIVPMTLLSLSAGKQEHYLIPALTPCAILASQCLDRLRRQPSPDKWASWIARPIRRRGLAVASLLVLGILIVQQWVLPVFHGRRAAADWLTLSSRALVQGETLLGVGHNIHWLGYYAKQRFIRLDSLEELFAEHSSRRGWILATVRERPAIATRLHILESVEAPAGYFDDRKRLPVLLRVEPRMSNNVSAN
ncbi:MAG: glycosyltransferase family 39 protein [Planctomycetota bacterium]